MPPGRGGGNGGLWALLVGTVLAFSLVIFMLVVGPTVGGVYDETTSQAVENQGFMFQMNLVRDIAFIFVPTLFGVGILLYVGAAIHKSESFFGSGPPR